MDSRQIFRHRFAKLLIFFRAFWEKISGIPPYFSPTFGVDQYLDLAQMINP